MKLMAWDLPVYPVSGKVLVEILRELGIGEFEVKLNHRRLLDAMLAIAGVPPQKFRWGGQAACPSACLSFHKSACTSA
jgi:hypothetical protein